MRALTLLTRVDAVSGLAGPLEFFPEGISVGDRARVEPGERHLGDDCLSLRPGQGGQHRLAGSRRVQRKAHPDIHHEAERVFARDLLNHNPFRAREGSKKHRLQGVLAQGAHGLKGALRDAPLATGRAAAQAQKLLCEAQAFIHLISLQVPPILECAADPEHAVAWNLKGGRELLLAHALWCAAQELEHAEGAVQVGNAVAGVGSAGGEHVF